MIIANCFHIAYNTSPVIHYTLSCGRAVLRSLPMRHIAYNTSPIIHDTLSCGLAPFGRGLAGHASRAGLAGRVSCLRSAGYVTRAGCVISALTDNC